VPGAVSAVIPLYNHERWIGEAVDSVRDQTLPVAELVVVDDGSSDRSLRALREHDVGGLRCLTQENRGAHEALNRGISVAKGDYVAILNSDDAHEPEWIESAYAISRARGAALVFGSVRLVDGEGAPLPPDSETARWYAAAVEQVRGAASLRAGVARENVAVTTSSFFLHRALWRALGGFRAYRYVHDYDFLLRALELCPDRVVFADGVPAVRYRVHERNTISEDLERALAERAAMLADLRRLGGRLRRLPGRARARRALTRDVDATPPVPPVGPSARAVGSEPPASLAPGADPAGATALGAASRTGLRVGLVVRSLGSGGLEEIVAMLAQGLPTEGLETAVLCTHAGGPTADRLRAAGVDVTLGRGRPDACSRWVAATAPDVLSTHFIGLDTMADLAGAGVPAVETVHNCYGWLDAVGWKDEASKRAAAAATVAVSETVARYHARHTPGDGPITVVPNAVHPGRAARAPRPFARRSLALDPDVPVLVHHGRTSGQKNLPGLLSAFERLLASEPDAVLLLAGPADRDTLARLRREHGSLFSRGSVRHLAPVRSVGILLAAADAYVSSSFYEGWSVAASEALWVGIPVVLSDCGGARELAGDGGARGRVVTNPLGDPMAVSPETLRVPPSETMERHESEMAAAMADVIGARGAWSERAAEVRAWARRTLAPARMVGAYGEILRKAAGRG